MSMRPLLSLVVASSLFLSAIAQEFTPEKRDSRNAFPELTIGDFKKCQDILKAPFPLLARWNTEMLSEKPDLKLCLTLKNQSAEAVMAIPNSPKKSVQTVVKNGLDVIQKNQSLILATETSLLGSDFPEATVAKKKANN